jgi:hypothetical protein
MAAPIGNKNAVGSKGGGRKSAYQELADAMDAMRIFFEEHSQEELEAKIASGKFSIKDRFLLNAMEGDTATVLKAYHKAVPDKVDHTSKGEALPLLVQFLEDNDKQDSTNTDGV